VATGLSHKTASLFLREHLAVGPDELPDALGYLHNETGNGVLVSTCNRTELYFVANNGHASHNAAVDILAGATGANRNRIERHTYFLKEESAIRHLHRVACGLDSMIFGEVEILGQLRTAMGASCEAGLCTTALDRLFNSAIHVGRRLHSETFIARHDRSVASAAVGLARNILGDIADRHVLVLGAGEAGAMTIRTMLREGAHNIRVANRTYRRAADLADHTGTVAVPLRRVPEILSEVDLVICASASPLVSLEALVSVMPVRALRPLVLIDIGVPRNVDPAVRGLPGVHLYDMEDLRAMCPVGPEEHARDMATAETVVDQEVTRFLTWWRSRQAVPAITAIEESVEHARQREMTKTLRRHPEFTEEQREAMEAMTKALVKKVLHRPVTRLKLHGDDPRYLEMGRELFGLEHEDGA
jgi:glutamyl-tRNA reductase